MSAEDQGREAAEEYRRRHELGHQPLGDLVTLIEQIHGIDVAVLPDGNPEAHGLTVRSTRTGVIRMAVTATRNPMRQRSNLAHELGHMVFDDHTDPSQPGWESRTLEESRATTFARHLLVPLQGLRAILGTPGDKPVTESTLSILVQRYQASPAIVAIQLAIAGYIDEATKEEWKQVTAPLLASKYGWAEQYEALQDQSDRHRGPQLLIARATQAYRLNAATLAPIARLRQINVNDLKAEYDEQGIVPAPIEPEWSEYAGDADQPAIDLDVLNAILDAPDEPDEDVDVDDFADDVHEGDR
jgi:Zn-dependent peptidase ImmA (M78 family)